MKNSNIYDDLFAKIQAIFSTSYQKDVMLQKICDLLHQSIPGYDWVGELRNETEGIGGCRNSSASYPWPQFSHAYLLFPQLEAEPV